MHYAIDLQFLLPQSLQFFICNEAMANSSRILTFSTRFRLLEYVFRILINFMCFLFFISIYFNLQKFRHINTLFPKISQTNINTLFPPLTNVNLQSPSSRNSPHGIFCSRTLNLRSISAIGYDMDYTLMHYNVMVIVSDIFAPDKHWKMIRAVF